MTTQFYQLLIQFGLLLVRSEQGCLLQKLFTFEGWTLRGLISILYDFFCGFHAMNMEYVFIQHGLCLKSTFHQKLWIVS